MSSPTKIRLADLTFYLKTSDSKESEVFCGLRAMPEMIRAWCDACRYTLGPARYGSARRTNFSISNYPCTPPAVSFRPSEASGEILRYAETMHEMGYRRNLLLILVLSMLLPYVRGPGSLDKLEMTPLWGVPIPSGPYGAANAAAPCMNYLLALSALDAKTPLDFCPGAIKSLLTCWELRSGAARHGSRLPQWIQKKPESALLPSAGREYW